MKPKFNSNILCFFDCINLNWSLRQFMEHDSKIKSKQNKYKIKNSTNCFYPLSAQVPSSTTWTKNVLVLQLTKSKRTLSKFLIAEKMFPHIFLY